MLKNMTHWMTIYQRCTFLSPVNRRLQKHLLLLFQGTSLANKIHMSANLRLWLIQKVPALNFNSREGDAFHQTMLAVLFN